MLQLKSIGHSSISNVNVSRVDVDAAEYVRERGGGRDTQRERWGGGGGRGGARETIVIWPRWFTYFWKTPTHPLYSVERRLPTAHATKTQDSIITR